MSYDGTIDDDSPVHGSAVSFNVRDFLHIKVPHLHGYISFFFFFFFLFFSPRVHTNTRHTNVVLYLSLNPPSLLAPLLSIHPHAGTIDPYYPPLASLSLSLAPCDGASSCSLIDEAPSRVPTAPYRLPLSLAEYNLNLVLFQPLGKGDPRSYLIGWEREQMCQT